MRGVGFVAVSHGVRVFSYNMIGQKQLRQFSATTSLPAQGEIAATAVEKAKRTVETLEQEKEELMDALVLHLKVASPSQVVVELLKPKHAKLKKSLDFVDTQLETAEKDLAEVRRQAAVAQQVSWRCASVCVCVCVYVSVSVSLVFFIFFLRDRRRCWMLRGSATR